jgi:hypothetical protein
MVRALGLALTLALLLAPTVAAHGDGGARGFRSTITAVRPSVDGLSVQVLDADDRLLLRNRSGREIVVMGYDGEPYLRFPAGGGVFRNANSPATYLNEERYGGVDVPATASAKAAPRWEQISRGQAYDWHDHRIHWMSTIDPPRVRREPDRPHRLYTWSVPGTVGGERLEIAGRLDYEPPPGGGFNPILLAPVVALALAGGIFWWARRRHAAADS